MPKTSSAPALLSQLRQELAAARRELENLALFVVTRKLIEQRVARLRNEIEDLEHPALFITCGELAMPRGTKGEP